MICFGYSFSSSDFSGILRGPASFGFSSSSMAGKRRMIMNVSTIMIKKNLAGNALESDSQTRRF